MTYYRQLARDLRRRRLSEPRIIQVLLEVQDLSTGTGRTPRDEFGPPQNYAAGFEEGRTRRPLPWLVSWFALMLALGFTHLSGARLRGGEAVLLPWWAVLVVATVVLAAGAAGRRLLEQRLPRGFVPLVSRSLPGAAVSPVRGEDGAGEVQVGRKPGGAHHG
ncbi:hypothetical protein ACFQ46_22640 [Kineococcus sp. GCM10028916]|uniref:hypothetical protein n=1 Tax=Kineococcus sp. GCM10028916 TaxID=3273394 RepID=UPI003636354E